MSDRPLDIWLSGTEHIYLISDLLEGAKEPTKIAPWQNQDLDRQTGRSIKLALEYALLALKAPGHKVIILDHYDTKDSHYRVQLKVAKLLDAMNIDYQLGIVQRAERDGNEFTGMRQLSDAYYVIALPKKPS